MNEKKGIELTRTDKPKEVSVTIGSTSFKPNGQPSSVRFEQDLAYVYLVIDTSGSMREGKLEHIKKGALGFAKDALTKSYQVGLISFSSSPRHICAPTNNIKTLETHITAMTTGGSTNMAEAIKMAHYHLHHNDKTRVMVIATDGAPDNKRKAMKEAEKAKEDKIDIITIGTDDADQDFLKKMATRAELGQKVTREVFSQAIIDASNLLPPPKSIVKR